MSVLEGLRSESKILYLENARTLQKYTIVHMIKLPKRYTATIVTEVMDFARQIYDDVQAANEYPTNAEEFKRRTGYLKRTLLNCHRLASQLDLAYELAQSENQEDNLKTLKGFAELIATEIRLVNGILKSDEKEFSHLKNI